MPGWIAAGASLLGGLLSSDASSDAADAQQQSSREATQLNRDIYNQSRADNEPWRTTGVDALNRIRAAYGLKPLAQPQTVGQGASPTQQLSYAQMRDSLLPQFTRPGGQVLDAGSQQYRQGPSTVDEAGLNAEVARRIEAQALQAAQAQQQGAAPASGVADMAGLLGEDPGYKFRLAEGTKAIERSAAARGGLLGGRTLKDLTKYQQGVASDEFGNAWNRIGSLAGTGQVATQNNNALGAQYGQTQGNLITGEGNARASGYVGSANALQSGIGGAINSWNNNRLLDMFQNRRPPSYVGGQTSGAYDAMGWST